MSEIVADIILNCQGLACPEPVIRCRNLLSTEHPTRLTVLVDNPAASENVSRHMMKNGYSVTVAHEKTGARNGNDLWRVCGQHFVAPFEPIEVETPRKTSTLVLITSNTLGQGSDELGARLMENFLVTLPELGDSLWRIVLLNGGVRLAATPGKALDSLRMLEASGVTVLVCGACLTHYQLLEAKAVGETTNMLDVVTSLDLADKVIRL